MPADLPLETDCRTLKQKLDDKEPLLLLDCRNPDEHATVNIPQAKLIPMGELPERVGEIAAYRDQPMIVHCHHGGRSLRVTRWLREQGFSQVQSLAGGIDQWAIEIDPSLPRY
jgi:rhodanese-related sulfurtransferase